MARRYTTISGLGRCSVILEGSNGHSRQRVRLAQHLDSSAVFFVHSVGSRNAFSHVTGWPTMLLLAKLDQFDWWIPLGSVEASESDQDDAGE